MNLLSIVLVYPTVLLNEILFKLFVK